MFFGPAEKRERKALKGQGFGLAVCKRLVDALKGGITFESEKGKGTKFTIKIPIEK
jgi:signal transduction histidine kinase